MIKPQAGDLWKCSLVEEKINEPSPEDWPKHPNLVSNGNYSATSMHNYWYVHDIPSKHVSRFKREWADRFKHNQALKLGFQFMMVTDSGDETRLPEGIEDGKNGWELCYRPGWIKAYPVGWVNGRVDPDNPDFAVVRGEDLL